MRIKLIKDWGDHRKGEIIKVSKKDAEWIMETGSGLYTKDMTEKDMKVK